MACGLGDDERAIGCWLYGSLCFHLVSLQEPTGGEVDEGIVHAFVEGDEEVSG